ncbi:MAG: CIA30 family protein [Zoogloeaceae bacterium]|jgi:hypothetical protein|nr:CIA30 family protein [Zoogloeaceae bacterium]
MTSDATGNAVTVEDNGAVSDSVYGGSSSSAATDNTVMMSGGTVSDDVFGGYCWSGCSDAFTGNTLNLHQPVTVAGLNNFEKYNFYLPATFTAGSALLTVTGTADLTDGASRSSTVNVGINGASSPPCKRATKSSSSTPQR